jgi:hypothetical protein
MIQCGRRLDRRKSNGHAWTVEQLSFVTGHKSVPANLWHDLISKFGMSKDDRLKIMKGLGRFLLDELDNLFRSFHRLRVSDGLLQVLGHSIRVKVQGEVQGPQVQGPSHTTDIPVHSLVLYINIALTNDNQFLCTCCCTKHIRLHTYAYTHLFLR